MVKTDQMYPSERSTSNLLAVDIQVDQLVQDQGAGNLQGLLVVAAQEMGRSCQPLVGLPLVGQPSVVRHLLDFP